MANEKEAFGLPKVLINFRTQSTTAIARSARGILVMILKNETTNTSNYYRIADTSDIPASGLLDSNIDLIKKALLGTPLRVLVYTLPLDSVTVEAGAGSGTTSGDGPSLDDEESTTGGGSSGGDTVETKLGQADILKKIVMGEFSWLAQ